MADLEAPRVWDGTVHASELHSFASPCRRKHWRRYSGREAPQEKPSQTLGKSIHKMLGDWLETGSFTYPTETISVPYRVRGEEKPRVQVYTPVDQVALARESMPHLPQPGVGITEVPFSFEFAGVPFAGTIDWMNKSEPEIHDHKTTANLRYAKVTKDLEADPQAIIYSYAIRRLFGRRPVECTWHYTQTRTKTQYRAVPFGFISQQLDHLMNKVAADAREVLHLHTIQPDPMSFPPDPSECEKYGGCPYRSDCTDVSDLQISLARMK
jgi:hypothetical protein